MARKREFDETQVLEIAMNLFWVQGYERTSMEDLVSHMGVHRKSIYDTFGNKHDLYLKALAHYKELISEALQQVISQKETTIEKIEALFVYALAHNKDQVKGCLIVNSAVELSLHDEMVAQMVRTNFDETEKFILQLIKEGQVTGEFSTTIDPLRTAKYIHNALIGVRVQLKTMDNREDLQPIIDMTLQVLRKNS